MLTDRNILLTGGAGSVGRSLAARFLSADPDVVRLFDISEPALAEAKKQLDDDRCRYLVGDIRDRERLAYAMQDVDVVVHAAAMKHVDITEHNPFEAVKTNVNGLQNVVDTAIDASVDKVVFTSSDKAANPANTMGTTKRLGEQLVAAGNDDHRNRDTDLASVRFGNVVNSSQSVVPLFHEQIRAGGPITLTDSRMTRFFLTFDGVADLVGGALDHMDGGEVFLRKMDAMRIEDLADAMITTLAPRYGHEPRDIDVDFIGRRVGETIHEEVMTDREAERAVESDELYAIPPERTTGTRYVADGGLKGFSTPEVVERSSGESGLLSYEEVVGFVEKHVVPESADEFVGGRPSDAVR